MSFICLHPNDVRFDQGLTPGFTILGERYSPRNGLFFFQTSQATEASQRAMMAE